MSTQNPITESANSNWFARIDHQAKPANLMLYKFIGAKFEAHCVPLTDSQQVLDWVNRIYHLPEIREVLVLVLFEVHYPDELLQKILPELCRLRDQK